IYRFKDLKAVEEYEQQTGHKLVPLTEKQAKELKPLSKRLRKKLLNGMPCPCASGKSFKKCCYKKYQHRKR
ncbi:MAG: SEC-C metal-binding domain-containing protein, partial [Nitrosarchaeum sp.]